MLRVALGLCLLAWWSPAQTLLVTGIGQQYNVADLPTASSNSGTVLWVRNANSTTVGATCSGGGTNFVPCKSNGTSWLIVQAGPATGGPAPYSLSFTSQTSVTLNHNLGTSSVLVACYNNASPPQQIAGTVALTDSNNVTVAFLSAQSGKCIVNGGVGPQGSQGIAGGTGTAPYSQAFSSTSAVLLVHNLGTYNVIVACYDNQSPSQQISGTVTRSSQNTTLVSFLSNQSGSCVVNGGVGPTGSPGSSLPKYHFNLTSATTYTVAGATHGLGTSDVSVSCLDAASPSNSFTPTYTVDRTSFDVVVTLLAAKSGGSCFIR